MATGRPRGSVRVSGTAGVVANLFAKVASTQRMVRATNRKFMPRARTRAKQLAPKDTGFMADSIQGRLSADGLVWDVYVPEEPFAAAGLVYYPAFVHDGTRLMAARPFMFWMFEEMRGEYEKEISAAVRAGMRARR